MSSSDKGKSLTKSNKKNVYVTNKNRKNIYPRMIIYCCKNDHICPGVTRGMLKF